MTPFIQAPFFLRNLFLAIFCLLMHIPAKSQHKPAEKPLSLWQQAHQQTLDQLILLRNKQLIPIQKLGTKRIATFVVGNQSMQTFEERLSMYSSIEHLQALDPANDWDLLIVAIHGPSTSEKEWQDIRGLLPNLDNHIIVYFGTAQSMAKLAGIAEVPALLLSIEVGEYAQEMAAELLFGAIGSKGKLTEALLPHFQLGEGLLSTPNSRLSYAVPEAVGWSGARMERRIDSIVDAGLSAEAYPGCQVLVAKEGKVLLYKAYGYHTYDSIRAVQLDDLYDFASITKVTGPLAALMKLCDEGKFALDVPLANYWPDFNRKDKRDLHIRDILAHQARLKPYIVYWEKTLKKNGQFKAKTFQSIASETYPVAVSPDLYLHHAYRKKIYKAIRKSPLNEQPGYVYSGLSFLLFPQIIKNLSGQAFDEYVQSNFYRSLGANTLGYNPYKRFPLDQIVPTEYDSLFRKRMVQAWVHDEAAAMFGGVSGNAGLFGCANDLAKLMQMYMNMGEYGGKRYISESTLREFSRYQFPEMDNRRGLGFDKPPLTEEDKKNGYVAFEASDESFGHSGFTGTFAWADPKHDLLLIFFSNRVYPSRDHRKLYSMGIRSALHQVLYDEIRWAE